MLAVNEIRTAPRRRLPLVEEEAAPEVAVPVVEEEEEVREAEEREQPAEVVALPM